MSSFYGLLFSAADTLPWDRPEVQGAVQLRAEALGVRVTMGPRQLGYLSSSYAAGFRLGQEMKLGNGQRLRIFANEDQARAWERWARRQEERWEHGLRSLLV